jgi:integrase/recombinase XerC
VIELARFIVTVQTTYEIDAEKSKQAKEKALLGDGKVIENKIVSIGLESMAFDDGIERPKVKENDITFLEPEEWAIVKKNIMNGVGSDRAKAKQKKWIYRDLLLFQIPIITGVRITALTEISFDDIDFKKHTINVIDKAREKTLFLDDETFELLLVWIKNRNELIQGYEDKKYLFISNQRKKMTVMSAERIVEKYTYNISKHITPHKLRSTCGTNMYRATRDIYLVADVLGHTSTATTKKYTKVGLQDRKDASKLIAQRMKGLSI